MLIARWETRGKKYWYELYEDSLGFMYYKGDLCGGWFDAFVTTRDQAITLMEEKVKVAAHVDKINMKRVK